MKILLVEDSATLRHAMGQYVKEAGHTPLSVDSGEAALQLLEDTPVDMIIMDVEMPGLNGFETTGLIREWLGDHWIPIVFVTGKSDDEDYRKGIEAGGDDYLIKPVSKMIIIAKIRAMERIAEMRDQLNNLNTELEALSRLDSLTQILNRRTFNEEAQKQWLLATRQRTQTAVLMIDVDHFKLYNDHYGHPAGDRCLKAVASAIESCLHRPYDLLGRYGGEEFVVMLPDTDAQGAAQVSQTIRQSVGAQGIHHEVSPSADRVTVSIGGASCSQTGQYQLEELIKAADRALYRAKHAGRNQVKVDEISAHRTVVIAHPDADVQQTICQWLQPHYNLITADNAQEGLELAFNIRPDLVILAADLSDIQGRELAARLRRAPRTRNTPLLYIDPEGTVSETESDTRALSQPLEREKVLKTAAQLLGR